MFCSPHHQVLEVSQDGRQVRGPLIYGSHSAAVQTVACAGARATVSCAADGLRLLDYRDADNDQWCDAQPPSLLAMAPNGQHLVLAQVSSGRLELCRVGGADDPGLRWMVYEGSSPSHGSTVHCLAVSPNGRLAATGGSDREIKVRWDGLVLDRAAPGASADQSWHGHSAWYAWGPPTAACLSMHILAASHHVWCKVSGAHT